MLLMKNSKVPVILDSIWKISLIDFEVTRLKVNYLNPNDSLHMINAIGRSKLILLFSKGQKEL